MMPNLMQFVVAMLGTLRAGGLVATCNPLYTARELGLLLEDARPRFLVVARPFVSTAVQAVDLCATGPGGEAAVNQDLIPELIITELGDLQPRPRRHLINMLAWGARLRRPKGPQPKKAHSFLQVLQQGANRTQTALRIESSAKTFMLSTVRTTGR